MNRAHRRRSSSSTLLPSGGAAVAERLEPRRLLCGLPIPHAVPDEAPQYERPRTPDGPEVDTGGIVWANRGTTDNFAGTYGAQANAARNVVDAAIAFWNRTIINFNQDGGNDQIDLTVTAQARGTGWGGNGGVDTLLGNKPRTSSINLGGGGDANGNGTVEDGEGFYIDPTPYDYSEFQGDIVNAWVGLATPGSAADNRNDLFSLVTVEIQHALGIEDRFTNLAWRQDPNNYLSPAGTNHENAQADTADTPGKLYYLNAPGIQALFTSNNGGAGGQDRGYAVHTARPSQTYTTGGVTYRGQTDTGTTGYLVGARYLPSYVGVQALAVMYGYSVNPPQDVGGSFYAVPDDAARRINVRNTGFLSNDRMEMRSAGGGIFITLDIGDDVPGTNMDGPFVCQFLRGNYDTVIMDGDTGNDILRTDGNNGVLVTMRGGMGDDALDISFIQRNLDLISASVSVEGGLGNDTLYVYDDFNARNNETYTFNSVVLGRVGTAGSIFYDSGVNGVILWTGSGTGTTNIASVGAGQSLFLNNVGGNDTVNIGSTNGLSGVLGNVQVENNPSFTTLNVNDTGSSVPRNATIDQGANNFGFLAGLAPGTIAWDNSDITAINVTTGGGADALNVLRCSERLFIRNSGGEDNVSIGNAASGVAQITGLIDVGPNPNPFIVSNLTINDSGGTVGRNYTWTPSGTGVLLGGLPASFGYENILFLSVLGGAANDSFAVNSAVQTPINNFWSLDGGGGADTLTVDDRTMSPGPFTAAVTSIDITRSTGTIIFPTSYTVRRSRIETTNYQAHNACTDVAVGGVAAGHSLNVFTGSGNDFIAVSPVDSAGNLTINGELFLNAGSGVDSLAFSAAGTTRAVNYVVTHLGGPGILHVSGLGAGLVGETGFDTVTFNAGDGDDTFAVNRLQGGAGVAINAGAGNDTCTIGNGDMSANLTNAVAFTFNGQTGSDTFAIANQATTTPWNYRFNTGSVVSERPATAYAWTSSTQSVENQFVYAGSAGDAFYVESTAEGVYTECNGFAGIDGLVLGGTSNTLENIRGPIVYAGGQDGGNMGIYDSADTTGDVVHLDAASLGAYAGDTLFGPGGSLAFTNLVNFGVFPAITLELGSGGDTLYAQPQVNGRIAVNANNPAAAPGDTLNLATAGLSAPLINGNAASGNLTSGNRQTLSWTGFEGSIGTDAVAPAVNAADINVNGIPGFADGAGNRQAVEVQFSENVSGRLSPSWLSLLNTTSAQSIPTSAIAVDYVAATNTARFTFPGLPNGVLPDGNYSGRVLAGLPDFFGNALPADAPFTFFFLQGDANHDGSVNLQDFNILASNFGQSDRTFSQGDFNYDGTVNLQDFNILAGRFGQALSPAAGAVTSTRGTPSDDELRTKLEELI